MTEVVDVYREANNISVTKHFETMGGELSTDVYHYEIRYPGNTLRIDFQQGTVMENGVNGITNESLLAIIHDRLTDLNGRFESEYNVTALEGIATALAALEARTENRRARGVEGFERA